MVRSQITKNENHPSPFSRLASFMCDYDTFQVTLSRTYKNQDLEKDLKDVYRKAGQKGQGITFLFTDNEIKEESFLEYMNNILSTGEVGGMFTKDEMEEIMQVLPWLTLLSLLLLLLLSFCRFFLSLWCCR